jgi:hypothetical protein
MHLDPRVKYALTVLALSVGVILLNQVGVQPFMARALATESSLVAAPDEEVKGPRGGTSPQERFWAFQPLRWRVSSFQETVDPATATYCSTVVSVLNVSSKSAAVEVEWYDERGVSKRIRRETISPGREMQFASDDRINVAPFVPENDAALENMHGYAQVHASRAKIQATANLVCREGTDTSSNLIAIKMIPTFPVGRTLDLF